MANNDQLQQMLEMMQQQMQDLHTLQEENTTLRANQAANTTTNPRLKTKAPDRPVINTNTNEREWELFKDSWNRYKIMTGISDANVLRMELRASCSQEVNKLLFEYIGADTLDTSTETDLLEHVIYFIFLLSFRCI